MKKKGAQGGRGFAPKIFSGQFVGLFKEFGTKGGGRQGRIQDLKKERAQGGSEARPQDFFGQFREFGTKRGGRAPPSVSAPGRAPPAPGPLWIRAC